MDGLQDHNVFWVRCRIGEQLRGPEGGQEGEVGECSEYCRAADPPQQHGEEGEDCAESSDTHKYRHSHIGNEGAWRE